MRFWHLNMTLLMVKRGHSETAILILHNLFCLLLRLKVFRSISLRFLHDSNAEYSDTGCSRVHILALVLLQDISDLIRLSRRVQRTYFIIYEFCFTCFKVEYKRSYIFSKSFQCNNSGGCGL